MLETILVYTCTAFLMYLFTRNATRTSKHHWVMCAFPILIYTMVFGSRYYVGVDYPNYAEMFAEWNPLNSFKDNSTTGIHERLETGFLLLIAICSKLNMGQVGFFSAISFIQILFIFLAFKDNNKEVLPLSIVAFFMTGMAMGHFQNGLRQYIAIPIFIFSLHFICERRLIPYLISIAIACLFHKSAAILFPIYFLYAYKTNHCYFEKQKTQIIILLCCFIITILDITASITSKMDSILLLSGYDAYLDSPFLMSENNNRITGTILIDTALAFVMILARPKVKDFYSSPFFLIVFDLFFIGTCFHIIVFRSLIIDRIFRYFYSLSFIVIGYYLYYFRTFSKKDATTFIYSILIVCMLSVYYVATIVNSKKSTIDYVNYYQYEKWQDKEKERQYYKPIE